MTRAESILASRLLDQAAAEFQGFTDMDPEYFEDIEPHELHELELAYNTWHMRETNDDFTPLVNIGEDMWMAYLAAVIGRAS